MQNTFSIFLTFFKTSTAFVLMVFSIVSKILSCTFFLLFRLKQPQFELFRDELALAKSVDALEEVSLKLKALVLVR